LESIEVYKSGNNDESFGSIINNKERNQGYVEFYDLEIENHPSYFANEIAVHNCHKLTNDAQNAILKLLEDAPKHVYIVLCTTDPDKLLKTIRTRCTTYEVKSLAEPTIIKLLKSVLKKEGILDYPSSVLKEIARVSDGCPRQALVLLDSVIDLEDEKKALAIVSASILSENNSLELCRALLHKSSWKEIAEIVSSLQDEPEKIRYAILTYFSKVLLDPKNKVALLERSSMIIDLFSESFIYSGKAGLVNALYISSK
jgi:DNA polymerase III gamma/tau subunit